MTIPPQEVVDAVLGKITKVTRRVDIFEMNGTSLYVGEVAFTEGSVSCDLSSTEARRTLSLTLSDDDPRLRPGVGSFWYDKIIKPFRGIEYKVGGALRTFEWQLGEFMIDNISNQDFPGTTAVVGRDYSKKLIKDKFGEPVAFGYGSMFDLVKTIATNGGVDPTRMSFEGSDQSVGTSATFEPDDTRWKAVTDIASAFNYEVYFNDVGTMVCRPQRDPAATEAVFTFQTGPNGSLATYKRSVGDARLYNDVVVTGEGSDPPVIGRATAGAESPVRPEKLGGKRTYRYNSGFIYTRLQAQLVAEGFLPKVALEEFDLDLTGITLPWLEVGDIVEFVDPEPLSEQDETTSFLLSSYETNMNLGATGYKAKRVLAVK